MSKHSYHKLDLGVLTAKDFTGSGKKKFIKAGKAAFQDKATGVAGEKVAKPNRGGGKQQSDGGVSRETGYRGRSAPSYKETP